MSFIARAHGDSWHVHDSPWIGPFKSKKKAEAYLREKYPRHTHYEIVKLIVPRKKNR